MTWEPPSDGEVPAGWQPIDTKRSGVPRWVRIIGAVTFVLVVVNVASGGYDDDSTTGFDERGRGPGLPRGRVVASSGGPSTPPHGRTAHEM